MRGMMSWSQMRGMMSCKWSDEGNDELEMVR